MVVEPGCSRRRALGAACLLALSGCALPPPTGEPDWAVWRGRLAMTIHSTPAESVQAGFELRGDASQGQLLLLTPIGTTAASADWTPHHATVRRGNDAQSFTDTQTMMVALTGAPLPLDALFDWLQARSTAVAGWSVDLGAPPLRRLVAKRTDPQPALTLRVVLNP